MPLEYCKRKLKNVKLDLLLKKDDSFDMVSSLGTRSPYMKRFISIINSSLVLGCSCSFDAVFSCFHFFPVHILLQQHRGIWTVHLESEGNFHHRNQVQAAIERMHKTQKQLIKLQVLKRLGRIPPHFPFNNRDLEQQNNPSNSMWKMSSGRADFSFPQLYWFCLFVSAPAQPFLVTTCCVTEEDSE